MQFCARFCHQDDVFSSKPDPVRRITQFPAWNYIAAWDLYRICADDSCGQVKSISSDSGDSCEHNREATAKPLLCCYPYPLAKAIRIYKMFTYTSQAETSHSPSSISAWKRIYTDELAQLVRAHGEPASVELVTYPTVYVFVKYLP